MLLVVVYVVLEAIGGPTPRVWPLARENPKPPTKRGHTGQRVAMFATGASGKFEEILGKQVIHSSKVGHQSEGY